MPISGEQVRIRVPDRLVGYDAFGDEIYETDERDVDGVLVAPGPRTDLSDVNRPAGVKVVFNLHFPKTFSGSLRGGEIRVRGEWFSVIGDPKPYTPENTPGRWNLPVEVETVNG